MGGQPCIRGLRITVRRVIEIVAQYGDRKELFADYPDLEEKDLAQALALAAERRPLSAVMCLKVARLFGGTPEVWMRLQAAYDLKKAERNKKVMQRVARILPIKPVEEVRV